MRVAVGSQLAREVLYAVGSDCLAESQVSQLGILRLKG